MMGLIAAVALMLAPVSPRAAGTPPGNGLEPKSTAILATQKWAACVAGANRSAVIAMLRQVPQSASEKQAALRVADKGGDCLSEVTEGEDVELRLPTPRLFRGPFFESLLKQDFDGFALKPGRTPFSFPDLATMAKAPALSDSSKASLVLADFAACVVAARPAESLALLATRPASRAEAEAINSLMPAFGPCFAKGSQFTINRPLLRGFIAEAAYRRAAGQAAGR